MDGTSDDAQKAVIRLPPIGGHPVHNCPGPMPNVSVFNRPAVIHHETASEVVTDLQYSSWTACIGRGLAGEAGAGVSMPELGTLVRTCCYDGAWRQIWQRQRLFPCRHQFFIQREDPIVVPHRD
jgi:hypothetical protein